GLDQLQLGTAVHEQGGEDGLVPLGGDVERGAAAPVPRLEQGGGGVEEGAGAFLDAEHDGRVEVGRRAVREEQVAAVAGAVLGGGVEGRSAAVLQVGAVREQHAQHL